MEDTAYLPDTTDTVPVGAFSHSVQLTSVRVGESCDTYTAENGILYSKDKTTLIAAPVGYGSAVVIPEDVTAIAAGAFAGLTPKSIVALGAIADIDLTAFSDITKAEATVALPSGLDYDARKTVWTQAGFTHFQEPAKPGDTTGPTDTTNPDGSQEQAGFSYELLDDYTLSVSWTGDADPAANLAIPASATLGSITYRVSSIANEAFANRTSLTSASIPASVTSIGIAAFKGCTQLTDTTLSENISIVGVSSFENTALTSIVLPRSVTVIGERAFADNTSLARIVALSAIDLVDATALEGCTQVSILTPYREDNLYSWTPGIAALGNHIEPYAVSTNTEVLSLTEDQSASLFNPATLFIPEGTELSYSYPATWVSVNADGVVAGKAPGSAEVVAMLMLDDIELARGLRSVKVTALEETAEPSSIFKQDETPEYLSGPLPLSGSLLALSGMGIAPRAVTLPASGTINVTGGCPWTIDAAGRLTINAGTLYSFDSSPWRDYDSLITSIEIKDGVSSSGRLYRLFYNLINLTAIDGLLNLNTANVTIMSGMFQNCDSLASLDLSRLNTSNVVNMDSMFNNCSSLTALNLSNFDISNVTSMVYMFRGCSSLTSLDLTSFDTAKAEHVDSMFQNTQQLATLKLGNNYTKVLPQKSKSDINAATQAVYTGWWIAQSDGSLYEGGENLQGKADTYIAQLTYAITFNANSSTSGVAPSNINAICGTSFQMPAQGDLLKTGYTFAGWNAKSDGSGVTYEASSTQTDLSGITNGVVELYAKWTPNTYTIRFNGNKPAGANVTGANDDIVATYDTAAKLPASGFICDGYAFTGWNTAPKGTGMHYAVSQEVTNLTSKQDDVVTFYAEWKGSDYTVSFEANPPAGVLFEGSTPDKVFQFGVWDSLPKNGYRCQGFSFKGWTVAQDGTGELYVDGQSAQNIAAQGSTSVRLYAQWAETYNVTVPVAPTISIDAQGQVTPDATTDTFFRSNNDVKVSVARIESVALPSAQEVFPNCPTDGSRWNAVQVTAADKAEPDPPIYIPINGSASTGFEIPGNEKFPVIFGLKIAPGTEIAYKEAATDVLRLTYVFAVAS